MNKTKDYDFTVIVPVYNEEDNMARVAEALSSYSKNAPLKTCILLVDDGSRDRSLELIKAACEANDNFFYITFEANHGLSSAMKAGIDAVESRYLGYIDADLQTNPEDFDKLLAVISDYQLVAGVRVNRKDTGFKRFQSRFANGFRRRMTGDTATDTGCPLKVMWTDYAKRLPFFDGMHRFLPALMMLVDGRFKELPVRHYPRTAGESKYNLWNRLKGPFVDCFVFRWMKNRYIRYQVTESNL